MQFVWVCVKMCRMRKQAERWGAELYPEDVESLSVKTAPFTVQSSERKVIIFLGYVTLSFSIPSRLRMQVW